MKHIYISCKHDRHTDDVFTAFTNEDDAKDQCRAWVESWVWLWSRRGIIESPKESEMYGDWCLSFSDDYYTFVKKVELMK